MAMSSTQRRVDNTCRLYRALIILLGGIPTDDRRRLDEEIELIPTLPNRVLNIMDEVRSGAIRELDSRFRLLAPHDKYIEIVETALEDKYNLFMLPKQFIIARLFGNFGLAFENLHLFPPHTRIGIDVRGSLAFTGSVIEWRLLEAALFEDAAILWNDVLTHQTDVTGVTQEARIPLKRFGALTRSTARAVFALLEGYINGIAVDIQWTTDINTFTTDQRELILERAGDGRIRFKRFRDKVMQYPKLAIGTAHPPIPENNPELALLLTREREWRDAVMHPTPAIEQDRTMLREQTFFEIEVAALRELIDAAISLIRQIDAALNGKFGSVSIWLHDRGEDGRFPDKAFF